MTKSHPEIIDLEAWSPGVLNQRAWSTIAAADRLYEFWVCALVHPDPSATIVIPRLPNPDVIFRASSGCNLFQKTCLVLWQNVSGGVPRLVAKSEYEVTSMLMILFCVSSDR